MAEINKTIQIDLTTNAKEISAQIDVVQNNIDYYSSVTNLEGDSLYSYNEANYFTDNKLNNGSYSFFIKRI